MGDLNKDRRYLLRKKDELLTERQQLLDRCVNESRDYNDTERSKSNALQNQIDRLDIQIREVEEIERQRCGIRVGGKATEPVAMFRNGGPWPRPSGREPRRYTYHIEAVPDRLISNSTHLPDWPIFLVENVCGNLL